MRIAGAVLALVTTLSVEAATVVQFEKFVMKKGDDSRWASPLIDDSTWTPVDYSSVGEIDGVVWLRRTVDVSVVERPRFHPLGITFAGLASHEIWWDGERIGAGGIVSPTADGEQPGPIESVYQIPDRLASPDRKHTLALRLSAHHRHFVPRAGLWVIAIADFAQIDRARSRSAWLAMIALSGIVLTSAFAFAMFFVDTRDRFFLILGNLCVGAALLLMAESWRSIVGYSYDRHIVRLVAVTAFTWFVATQLVALVVARFPDRRGPLVRKFAAAAAALCALIPFWDGKALAMLFVGLTVSLGWVTRAVVRGARGSVLALVGVGVVTAGLLLFPLRFPETLLFFLLDALFICLLCSHALDVRRDRAEKAEAVLKSARLELEMLKRQLQPHFLMNTLTALSEWIERDPKAAVRMIDALASEMRILSDIASERLIPADDELNLCRAHLVTMQMRKNVRYHLETEGFEGDELVPPGTFLTLVENAVTHGATDARVSIRIRTTSEHGKRLYSVESPAVGTDEPAQPGTGTRYIEARLREAWGDRWSFAQGRQGPLWRAEIVVPQGAPS